MARPRNAFKRVPIPCALPVVHQLNLALECPGFQDAPLRGRQFAIQQFSGLDQNTGFLP
jgi:hypothetical protein